jgi:hypothetical protein
MNIKASGRAALIIAAGFCASISSPVQAGEADGRAAASQGEPAPGAPVALNKFRKHRHWKHAASHRKPVKAASRVLPGRSRISEPGVFGKNKAVDLELKEDDAADSLPASVANAHAQLADADASADSAAALTSQARNRLQLMAANQPAPAADAGLVEPDQLNEVDRALSEARTDDKAPAATEARADDKARGATPAMAVAQPPSAAASTDDSSWGQASLIGKIFIAFGGLLTLASAARMFMA